MGKTAFALGLIALCISLSCWLFMLLMQIGFLQTPIIFLAKVLNVVFIGCLLLAIILAIIALVKKSTPKWEKKKAWLGLAFVVVAFINNILILAVVRRQAQELVENFKRISRELDLPQQLDKDF